ncbi:MAG: TolC family protein [Desulfobacteraceae bacterium]|nr:MAG: TolC family protein [Desulfobacteraceae bacterium]
MKNTKAPGVEEGRDAIRKAHWRKIAACFFLLVLIPAVLSAGASDRPDGTKQQYSLEELYRLGIERSEEIQIARNQLFIAEKDVDRAFSVLVPQLSGFGDYIQYNASDVIQPKSGHSYGVKLQQQFTVNGRELIVFQAAKDTTVQREYDMNAVMESFLYTVAQDYFDIVNKHNRLVILQDNVNRLEAHRDAVLKKMALEEAPKTDLLRTEAELSGSRSELIQSENALILARSTLSRLLELPGPCEVIVPDMEGTEMVSDSLDALIHSALAHRSEIKSLETSEKLAQAQVDITRSEYWPKLSLEAGYKFQGSDPSYYAVDETLYGAASLNMTLFDWGLRSATISQDKAAQRNVQLQLDALSKQVALEVEKAYLVMLTARSSIQSLRDKLKFSKASYEAVSLQFQLGQADILDIMDANTVLKSAEQELSEALYYFSLSRVGLKRAQGIFLSEVKNELGIAD